MISELGAGTFNVDITAAGFKAASFTGINVVAETPRFATHGTLGSYTKFGMDPQEEALKRGEIPGAPGWGRDPQMGTLITKKGDGFDKRQVPNVPGNYLAYYEGIRDAISLGSPNTPMS